MYDGLQMLVKGKRFHNQLVTNCELGMVASIETGVLKEYYGNREPFFIHAWPNAKAEPSVLIRGSLHKYYLGNNDGLFRLKDIRRAIDRFSREYGLREEDNNVIQKIEIGINLYASYPKGVIDAAMLFNGRTAKRDSNKKLASKYWHFDQYEVKLYKKGENTLRFEVRIIDMRKIKSIIPVRSLFDLKDIHCGIASLKFLHSLIDSFLFVPVDKENVLKGKDAKNWGTYRADSYWEELDRFRKCRNQKRVKKIISEYSLINWNDYLKRNVADIAEKILGVSRDKIFATKSTLGLLGESVARPNGKGNRQTDIIIQPDEASIYRYDVELLNYSILDFNEILTVRPIVCLVRLSLSCRSPPIMSTKRMFYRNYAANEKISFKPSFDVYLLVQKS